MTMCYSTEAVLLGGNTYIIQTWNERGTTLGKRGGGVTELLVFKLSNLFFLFRVKYKFNSLYWLSMAMVFLAVSPFLKRSKQSISDSCLHFRIPNKNKKQNIKGFDKVKIV